MASFLRSAKISRLLPVATRIASRVSIHPIPSRIHTTGRSSIIVHRHFEFVNQRCLAVTTSRLQSTSPQQVDTEVTTNVQQVKSDNEFRIVLRRLDDMVRRTGRITKTQLLLVLDEVCKLGAAKPNQALLLIRSCGSLLPEVPHQERTALVSSIWDKLQQLGTNYDVTHYNALLRVYLQNEHQFSPTDFLAKMEARGIEPNRITYQRLISSYCLQGDIQGATKILEFMKSEDLSVTEGIFNSLITGHGRAGDLENSKNIIDVMRTVGLEASADTYTALMCAYAEKGHIESIEQLAHELESESQGLSGRSYLSVAYSLATSGHSEQLPKILEKIQLNTGYIPDTINLALSLMTKGQNDAAFDIVKMFMGIRMETTADGDPQNQGNFFIDHAVQMQMPQEALFGYLDEMKASGMHSIPHVIALHSALRKAKENEEYAFGIMQKMVAEGIPVRAHYFWPLFARDAATGNKDGLLATLKTMNAMGIASTPETYTNYVFPYLGDSLEQIKGTLMDLGIPADKFLVTALCRNEVMHQRLDNIVQLINEYHDLVDIPLIRAGLVTCFRENPQVEPMVRICKHLVDGHEFIEDTPLTKEDYFGGFLFDLVASVSETRAPAIKPHLHLFFTKLADEGLKISGARYRGIRNQLDRIKLPMLKPVAMTLMDKEEIRNDRVANFDILSGEEVSVEELEKHLVELREKDGNLRGIMRRLILVHANSNNYQRALELKKDFEEAGYEPTGAIFASMINMCCNLGKFGEALEFKEKLRKFDPSFKLDVSKYRFLISTLAQEKRLPEAIDMLEEMKELDVKTDRMEKQIFHLLNDLAALGLSEEVERIFDTIVEIGVIKPSNNLLGPVVTAYINKNDMEGALACIRDCQAKYSIMPHFQDVLVRLVESGDTDRLQRAMDFASQQHGDINMLYDLIFAFCSTGKYKEAMKLIETPGMIAKNRRLQWYAERCIGTGLVEPLEQLTAMTKDLYACDRDQMHFYLIQLHTRNNDVDKCLQVWTQMQDEDVVPRDRTMRYLANVLRSNDRPIPFEVPQLTVEQLQNVDLGIDEMIIRIAKAGNQDGALDHLKQSMADGKGISPNTFHQVMFEMLKLGNIEGALAVNQMAESADESFQMSLSVRNKLMIEYIRRGDAQNAENMYDHIMSESPNPIQSGLRMLSEKYEADGDVERLLALKAKYEARMERRFPFGKSLLGAYIVKDDIDSALSYIEQEMIEDGSKSRRIGMRSFCGKLIQRELPLDNVYAMVDRLSALDIDGPAWQLLYAHLDHLNAEGAKRTIERYPAIKERSTGLVGYIIEMMDSDNDVVGKIEQVLDVTKDQEYLDRSKVYFYLLKVHDIKNDHTGGLLVKQRMEEEGLQLSEFMLKRLAQLLKRTNQPVPFEEPPNTLSFYREKLKLEGKDILPEINVPEEEES